MNDSVRYRLADSTLLEPLVNGWAAWANTLSPVPASLHLLQYQIPVLESYLENPGYHAAAADNPDLVGGPFAGIPVEHTADVAALLEATRSELAGQLALARALRTFHNDLVERAHGESLEPFYERLPAELRGYVELVYDYYHRPFVRVLEPLLYRSPYYAPRLQSVRISTLAQDEARPHFLNTPRVPIGNALDWRVPFADARLDRLAEMTCRAAPLAEIEALLDSPVSARKTLTALLSEGDAALPEVWTHDTTRVKYFGHACLLFERKGVSVLTDPFVAARPSNDAVDRYSYNDLPSRIDVVLVTHTHQDHFALETLLRLRHRIGMLVVPRCQGTVYGDISLKLMAETLGFPHVVEVDTLDEIPLPDGAIHAIPFFGEHSDMMQAKSGYVIRAGKRRILVGADSDCLDREIYQHVREALGRIDTVFIGMECVGAPLSFAYGSLLPHKPRREHDLSRRQRGCDHVRALDLLETVGAGSVYNYAMGLEPWMRFILGLNVTPDSEQWQESEALLDLARPRGFAAAERLCGRAEFILDNEVPSLPSAGVGVASVRDETEQFLF